MAASTHPADAIPPEKRHHRHRERGVLSLAAIGAVSLLWLGLDAPGLKLIVPRIARDETETPVIANLAVARDRAEARRPSLTTAVAPAGPARDGRRRRDSKVAAAVLIPAPRTTAAPAPQPAPPDVPTSQPPQISVQSPDPSPAPSAPPASPPPAPSPPAAPVGLTPVASQVVTTAVSTVTAAVQPTSDVTAATQQVTSTLPTISPLHP